MRLSYRIRLSRRHGVFRLPHPSEAVPVDRGQGEQELLVLVLQDEGLFLDGVEPALGVWVTSPVQTYLDLAAAGERGREAADYLRNQGLRWPR